MTREDYLLLLLPVAYLLGSIPFGLIVGLSQGVDPRTAGSGNIGATNVGRLLGGKFFALVFALDLLKGMAPMLAAGYVLRSEPGVPISSRHFLLWIGIGVMAILGHMFSCFLKFKGGKGVATSAGIALGLYPYFTYAGLIGLAVWLAIFKMTRYVSVASIAAAVLFPVAYAGIGLANHWDVFDHQLPLLIFSTLIALMIVYRHRANIARLRDGTENRFGPKG